jgi:hypothetical protein
MANKIKLDKFSDSEIIALQGQIRSELELRRQKIDGALANPAITIAQKVE